MNTLLIDDFILYLQQNEGLADNTCISYATDLTLFVQFIGDADLRAVDSACLSDYLNTRVKNGISATTNARIQSSLKRFYRYLLQENHINENPAAQLSRPKQGRRLPKSLSQQEVEALLAAPDTGLRVTELVSIHLHDFDLNAGVLKVMGKGSKFIQTRARHDPADFLACH